jgi:S1-C subfamily serine protease
MNGIRVPVLVCVLAVTALTVVAIRFLALRSPSAPPTTQPSDPFDELRNRLGHNKPAPTAVGPVAAEAPDVPAPGKEPPAKALVSPRPDSTPPKEAAGPVRLQPALETAILDRVRNAAVFLQVKHVSYLNEKTEQESSGSGFFISNDGRIATCWHVVHAQREAPELVIPLKIQKLEAVVGSGTRHQLLFPARLLAADPASDLAILKVEYRPEAWLEFGDSNRLVPTTPVWVLGYPLGKVFSVLQRGPEYSINRGHVSSLRHDDLDRLDRIQFDAAVTPGNSGGPVFGNDGNVVGVTNIAVGTSRVNFAVPASKILKLLADCPLARGAGDACAVTIDSTPAGAQVYLNGHAKGITPLQLKEPAGWNLLQLSLPGRRNRVQWTSLYDGLKINAELEPLECKTLKSARNPGAPAPDAQPLPHGAPLLTQDFTDSRATDAWRQETGGGGTRSWYVEGGGLHQWSGDALLHAIFTGDERWTDYAFSARVRIAMNERDGRAGLIFRSTANGFALFRLHREKRVVQLAHHCNDPFGWQVLAERKLPFAVEGGRWYQLEVQTMGNRVRCFIDGQPVLEAVLDLASEGGVGFYSVDAQASFDDLHVLKLDSGKDVQAPEATVNSYWFNESFQSESAYWNAFQEETPAPPWPVTPGACLQLDKTLRHARNRLERYDLYDSHVAAKASCAEGVLGVVLRDDGKRRYVCGVDCETGRVFIQLVDGSTQKVLVEKSDSRIRDAIRGGETDFGPLIYLVTQQTGAELRFRVVLIGAPDLRTLLGEGDQEPDSKAQVRMGVLAQVEVQATDATLPHGRLGLYADRARVMFHSVQVSDDGEE